MSLKTDLYSFLLNPKELKQKKVHFLTVLKEFLIYDLTITIFWAVLIALFTFLFEDFAMVFKNKETINGTTSSIFLLTVFIGPLIEEIAYRLSLKIDRITISISLSVQFIIYLHLLKIFNFVLYERIFLMAILSVLLYFTVSKKLSVFLVKNFNIYLYFNVFVFSLLHAFNFHYFELYHYFFIPILISLQFFFALYLSYIRIQQNFLYVVVFHIIHNSIIYGVSLINA